MSYHTKFTVAVWSITLLPVVAALALDYKQKGRLNIVEMLVALFIIVFVWSILR